MPTGEFDQKLERLLNDLVLQFDRAIELSLRAAEAYFNVQKDKARKVIDDDDAIDKVDVLIERRCVELLSLGVQDERRIRSVLMAAKVNNEVERIADCAVNVAEVVDLADDESPEVPNTFRVMANSVIGMLRETRKALADLDPDLANKVLRYDETVEQFKQELNIENQRKVASGDYPVPFAFRLRRVTANLERMADHCTNICMQVIYLAKGMTVKHRGTRWSEPSEPTVN